ncbi:MAG: type II secretion system F family protein [Bacilli bacterium]
MLENLELPLFQLLFVLFLTIILFYLIKLNKALKLEEKIGSYTVKLIIKENSLSDNLFNFYNNIINKITNFLIKIKIFNKYSKRYIKYIDSFYNSKKNPLDFVSLKILLGFLLIIIYLIIAFILFHTIKWYLLLLFLLSASFLPDIFLIYQEYQKKERIKKDLLNAIIIMNNAFKSGRSIMQAIDIVQKELDGPIKEEFHKMHLEIIYGLSLEVVLKHFAKRVQLEEAGYVASSLTVLNKTGGNIIKVFSSIERSLFSKKKLELELNSLTASSKALSKFLLILPFIFSGMIIILNPLYFEPLIKTRIGLLILGGLFLFYTLYIFLVGKIMKVRF